MNTCNSNSKSNHSPCCIIRKLNHPKKPISLDQRRRDEISLYLRSRHTHTKKPLETTHFCFSQGAKSFQDKKHSSVKKSCLPPPRFLNPLKTSTSRAIFCTIHTQKQQLMQEKSCHFNPIFAFIFCFLHHHHQSPV